MMKNKDEMLNGFVTGKDDDEVLSDEIMAQKTELDKLLAQEMFYNGDPKISAIKSRARDLADQYNATRENEPGRRLALLKELFGSCDDDIFIKPPFHCDYGFNIEVGKNFFANYNCTILDVAKVIIGDNCQMAPNVAIYTAGHPVHPDSRNSAYEYGISVTMTAECRDDKTLKKAIFEDIYPQL